MSIIQRKPAKRSACRYKFEVCKFFRISQYYDSTHDYECLYMRPICDIINNFYDIYFEKKKYRLVHVQE